MIEELKQIIDEMGNECDKMGDSCDNVCRDCPYNPHFTDNVFKYLNGERLQTKDKIN